MQRAERVGHGIVRMARSARLRALLSIGLLMGVGAVGTLAAWSDEAVATSGTISTGSIDIRADEVKDLDLGGFAKDGMRLGDAATHGVVVSNNGNIPLVYTMDVQGRGGLANDLLVSAHPGTCDAVALAPGPVAAVTDGTTLAAEPRALGPGGRETICFTVRLDPDAPLDVAGSSADLTVTLNARSEANP